MAEVVYVHARVRACECRWRQWSITARLWKTESISPGSQYRKEAERIECTKTQRCGLAHCVLGTHSYSSMIFKKKRKRSICWVFTLNQALAAGLLQPFSSSQLQDEGEVILFCQRQNGGSERLDYLFLELFFLFIWKASWRQAAFR